MLAVINSISYSYMWETGGARSFRVALHISLGVFITGEIRVHGNIFDTNWMTNNANVTPLIGVGQ